MASTQSAAPPPAPRVSIGLPVYNGDDYLGEALESILGQTFSDFELIICDNASTDATEALCREYADRDPRIRYERNEKNLGAAQNYNLALEKARAPYFRWACHDDKLAPRCIEACVEVLDSHPNVVLAYPRTQVIDETGTPIDDPDWITTLDLRDMAPSRRFAEYLQVYRWGGGGGQLFGLMRTDVLRSTMRHGDFPSADLILIGEMTLHGDIYEVPDRLFLRRLHEENSILSNDYEIDGIWEWFDPEQGGDVKWLEWRWLWELIGAIRRAPIGRSERRKSYRVLFDRYVRKHGRKLVKEILYVLSAKTGLSRNRHGQKVVGLRTMYKIF